MSDREHARALLGMARRDLGALRGMCDSKVFSEEIFGFHAQQAAEKALKAWLAHLEVEYPKTHDLSLLIQLLQATGAEVARHQDLIDLNPFAVQFRYEAFELDEEPMDRQQAIARVGDLLGRVEALLGEE